MPVVAKRSMSEFVLAFAAAMLVSVLLGYLNLHNDEVELPLGILLVSSFAFGLASPRRSWLWASIVALGIPLSSLLSLKTGVYYPCRQGHPYSCESASLGSALSTFALLMPALVSAYIGVRAGRGKRADSPVE